MAFPYGTVKKRKDRDIGDGMIKYPISPLALLIIPFIIYGCTKTVTGPKHLYPENPGVPGYSVTPKESIFENGLIKLTVTPLRPWANRINPPLVDELLGENFIILTMAIENRSREKALYNPANTSLTDSRAEYRKPLDYTDLYDIVKRRKEGKSPESELGALKGIFYDLNETILPGRKTSKLLIFRPLSEKGTAAVLRIKGVYIGTDTVDVYFPFSMRGAEVRQQ
jgi:hypothetical protein